MLETQGKVAVDLRTLKCLKSICDNKLKDKLETGKKLQQI